MIDVPSVAPSIWIEAPETLSAVVIVASCELDIVPVSADVGSPVASCKLKAGVVSLDPRETETPPKFTAEFALVFYQCKYQILII